MWAARIHWWAPCSLWDDNSSSTLYRVQFLSLLWQSYLGCTLEYSIYPHFSLHSLHPNTVFLYAKGGGMVYFSTHVTQLEHNISFYVHNKNTVMCAAVTAEPKKLLQGGACKHKLPPPHHSFKLWHAVRIHIENSSGYWLGVEGTDNSWKDLSLENSGDQLLTADTWSHKQPAQYWNNRWGFKVIMDTAAVSGYRLASRVQRNRMVIQCKIEHLYSGNHDCDL
jgi:hypothetical protein